MSRVLSLADSIAAAFGLDEYVGLVPGVVISFIVSVPLGAVAARLLRVRRAVGWLIVMSLGVIVSATLTPGRAALEHGPLGQASCDLSRTGLVSLQRFLELSDRSLNILLFVPLGAGIALVPRSPRKTVLVGAAVVLPFAIEATQLALPALGRTCQGKDVVDNLTGLLAGGVLGTLAGRVAPVAWAGVGP